MSLITAYIISGAALWLYIGWACWFSWIAGTVAWGTRATKQDWKILGVCMALGLITFVLFFWIMLKFTARPRTS